jgi:hypothetical protein
LRGKGFRASIPCIDEQTEVAAVPTSPAIPPSLPDAPTPAPGGFLTDLLASLNQPCDAASLYHLAATVTPENLASLCGTVATMCMAWSGLLSLFGRAPALPRLVPPLLAAACGGLAAASLSGWIPMSILAVLSPLVLWWSAAAGLVPGAFVARAAALVRGAPDGGHVDVVAAGVLKAEAVRAFRATMDDLPRERRALFEARCGSLASLVGRRWMGRLDDAGEARARILAISDPGSRFGIEGLAEAAMDHPKVAAAGTAAGIAALAAAAGPLAAAAVAVAALFAFGSGVDMVAKARAAAPRLPAAEPMAALPAAAGQAEQRMLERI